ncbi:MAG: CocE/NonD family hydrolase [Nitriliruptoraceae bacterium]
MGKFLAGQWLLGGAAHRVTEMIPAPDGVKLATDVYLAGNDGNPTKAPTIVERTPYDRRSDGMTRMAQFFVARGYHVVLQDTRGRGDSEGMFQHYFARPHEGEDGFSLLDWICEQPWSDGTVGTTGLSYTGSNQQSLAILGHPAIKTQVILDAGINYFKNCVRENGAFVRAQLGKYALKMALTSPQARQDPTLRAALEENERNYRHWFLLPRWRRGYSPVSALPEYEDWLLFAQDEATYGPGWANPQMNLEPYLDDYPDIPLLMFTSWYGHHQAATIQKLEHFAHHRTPKKLIIGPWIHTYGYGEFSLIGDVDVGDQGALNIDEIRARWFDAYLRGIEPERVEASPAVTYYLIGSGSGRRNLDGHLEHGGRWLEATSWPPAEAADTTLALTSHQELAHDDRPRDGAVGLRVNLANPVPTIGGSIRDAHPMGGLMKDGAQDQRELAGSLRSSGSGLPLAARPDVAAFRSDPLEAAADVTGPVYLDVWVRSESPSCDLAVKLVDEYPSSNDWPNGYAMNLSEIYTRFASWTRQLPGLDEDPVHVRIGPFHIGNVFEAGHRIRVDMANSNAPRYDQNPEALPGFRFEICAVGSDGASSVTVPTISGLRFAAPAPNPLSAGDQYVNTR